MSALPAPGAEAAAIDVMAEAGDWSRVPDAEEVTRRAALAALKACGDEVPWPCEVAVTLTDDAAIRVLNRDWRAMDKPTNVLSFPQADLPEGVDAPQPLGDIIVAIETLEAEAVAEGKAPAHHLAHLVVHGTLHLMGYDHLDDDEAEEMEALERRILAGLGIDDPYRLPQDG
ncbi:rRNA maturation RNase YbeY [Xanthobacter tagetidis]|uniref:Endoribonuclease YbeY n=1 Tax=Xanthobacter tagetidis TaxID=60216 RepID=A0A3L7A3I9_9HYPH|nr:rRNA maturation RNase YbeY [Xanthobacter tagetidis]MBB6308773.1 putative rRNA maturation factor [Xanthobacter tagetidis]RLP74829.1 rRNA maturation RNase YbeY [Xanthobacter tagetidis]